MGKRRSEQPEWVVSLAASTVDELIEHVAARVAQIEKAEREEGTRGLQEGQLAPALILAIQDRLKPVLDAMGTEAIEAYTDARRAAGEPIGKALGEELGPLLGLSRAGVYNAFGRQGGARARA